MASGDVMRTFEARDGFPPSTNYATPDTRNSHPVYDFDADTDESLDFTDILPAGYGGGGLTVDVHWSASSATSNNCRWDAQFERIVSLDIDADSFAAVQSATGAAPGTSGDLQITSIAFTSGAQMDSLAAGERYRLRVTRDANHATDDSMAGDAELNFVVVKET